jgi:putative flavoprotein involved in K+ transport
MTRLPGWSYRGPDPAGFMPAKGVSRFLAGYAASFAAPVTTGAEVLAVRWRAGRYLVSTTAGQWTASAVVVATGACQRPAVPDLAARLHPSVRQLTPDTYRNPGDVAPGRVLVVGASATGAQLADEIHAAGHDVVLSVGRHTRLPRRYRGLDILRWLDALGTLHRPLGARRRHPEASLQLVGDHRRSIDLPSLAGRGIRLTGRLEAIEGRTLRFSDDLAGTTAAAEARLENILARIDVHATATGLDRGIPPPEPPTRHRPVGPGVRSIDLAEVRTVLWATGYRRSYPWLQVPVLDDSGEIRQVDGRTDAPGLYTVGLPNQTRRASTLIDGVGQDAALVVDSLLGATAGARVDGRAS